ncbi:MAG: YkgJ family cysteine cluster protein [Methanothrix sp.]|nr:YkgJ family cysteine cluster protein [Methanothrix sp.]
MKADANGDAREDAIMEDSGKEPKDVAIILLKATSLPDERIFLEMNQPRYTTVDYYRMACNLLFKCRRCGTCCATGNPIRIRTEDAAALARHFKIPLNKAVKKYTAPDTDKPGSLVFKHTLPCKFYDAKERGCKLYLARPWSCRIFPFLGIYGSEDKVKVNESCPGSVETMKVLMASLQEARSDPAILALSPEEIRAAKEKLRAVLDTI